MAKGTYSIVNTLALKEGVSIYGGYSGYPNWTRVTGQLVTFVLSSASPMVSANAVNLKTVISSIEISARDRPVNATQKSSYGIYAVNSRGLIVSDCRIVTVAGLPGADGTSPPSPRADNGQNGLLGQSGCEGGDLPVICGSCSMPNGGSGGNSVSSIFVLSGFLDINGSRRK